MLACKRLAAACIDQEHPTPQVLLHYLWGERNGSGQCAKDTRSFSVGRPHVLVIRRVLAIPCNLSPDKLLLIFCQRSRIDDAFLSNGGEAWGVAACGHTERASPVRWIDAHLPRQGVQETSQRVILLPCDSYHHLLPQDTTATPIRP